MNKAQKCRQERLASNQFADRKSFKKHGLKPARLMTDEKARLEERRAKSRNPFMVGVQIKKSRHARMECKTINFLPFSIVREPAGKDAKFIHAFNYNPTPKPPSRQDLHRMRVAERKAK